MGMPRVRFTVRRVIVGLAALAAITGGAAWALLTAENRITVVNHSGREIALVIVAVSGSTSCVKFERLPDGGMASAPFLIEGDGGFYIHGRMWGRPGYGAEFGGRSYGYVTRGMGGDRVRFVIERGG
jgi:hypothetical protein